uniref:Cytochrome b6-f complex subunit n=1 Tax=Asparagopsis taxiformis TaxID=260499 RepID=A0A1C9CBX0_9FLOR|nr:cytochrome b6-f complex subunit [Asparagopsis taxiformis]AOM65888.1 cytochrome b6-f complex subunit [Asparagopsis taxiformis]
MYIFIINHDYNIKTHCLNQRNIYQKYIPINDYLQKKGRIIGIKNIKGKYVHIIEFDNYTRIWMLPEEIEIISLDMFNK